MFFVFSKILAFLISPLTWILILLVITLLLKKSKTKKIFSIITVCFSFFFTNTFIAKEFMRMWEYEPVGVKNITKHYDAVIILGGGIVTNDAQNDILTFRDNPDRLMQALWLYQNGVADKILISSGSGSLEYPNMLEGKLLADYLIEIGLPENDIWVDSLSKNTRENAVNTVEILNDSIPNGNFLLITSASHMRRSVGCFKKLDFNVDPFPVDFVAGERSWFWMNLLIPNSEALEIWNDLLHEVFGVISYKIKNYI